METVTIIAGTLNIVILGWLVYSVRNLNVKVEDINTLSLDIVDMQSSMDTRFDKTHDELDGRLNTVHNKMHQLNDDTIQTLEKMDDKLTSFERTIKDTSKKY
jgi:hypothetical protein